MDYLLRIILVIALISCSFSQDEDELTERYTTDYSEESDTTMSSSIALKNFTVAREKHLDSTLELEPAEKELIKSTAFYSFVEDYLYKDNTLKKYPRRIDCIIDTLKKKNSISEISTDDMDVKFLILETTNSSVTVAFENARGFMDDINSNVENANYSCLLPGLVSVTILASILLAIISLVICTNKNNPLPSEA